MSLKMSNKSSKAELIAIYRLEFYKKQKKWKLSHNLDKNQHNGDCNKISKNLNKTYDIMECTPSHTSKGLNDAFIETDFDQSKRLNYTKAWSSQQSERAFPKWEEIRPLRANVGENWGSQSNQEPEMGKLRPYETYIGWPVQRDVWSSPRHGPWSNNVWSEDNAMQYGGADNLWSGNESPREMLSKAEDWQRRDEAKLLANEVNPMCCHAYFTDMNAVPGKLDSPQCVLDQSLGNEPVEFMRGIHDVAHSSENEMEPHDDDCADALSPISVAMLSPRQLAAAVGKHARALRHLLAEATAREPARNTHMCSCGGAPLDPPTRDAGPTQPTQTQHWGNMLGEELMLAGSYMNSNEVQVCAGSGRGTRENDPMIGISMGRPYRM